MPHLPLYDFYQLSDTAKQRAVSEVINDFVISYNKNLANAKLSIKSNIDRVINNRARMQSLRNELNFINELKGNTQKVIKIIAGNFLDFHADGTYHRYMNTNRNTCSCYKPKTF